MPCRKNSNGRKNLTYSFDRSRINIFDKADVRMGQRPSAQWSAALNEGNTETTALKSPSLGEEIVGRINELAAISETSGHLARLFLTKEHRAAAELILGWMQSAGMNGISTPSATFAAATRANSPACPV
jgi:hypothetical protein